MKLLLLLALTISSVFAFEPIYKETMSFKSKASKKFKSKNHPKYCRFETRFDDDKQEIEIRVGIIGSPVSFFGWGANIKISEFPLKAGFKRVVDDLGLSKMILSYDGRTLSFKDVPRKKVWNRIYNFSIDIDNQLLKPGKFKGVMKGFETNFFGFPKKHSIQFCNFKGA